jgi:hypothetical protein
MTVDYSAAPAPTGPRSLTPPRRADSVRRTATMDVTWPDGAQAPMAIHGRCRDAHTTDPAQAPSVLGESQLWVRAALDRVIREVHSVPTVANLESIVGARAGGRLREVLRTALPHERQAGTRLYLLLDDLSGVTLVGGVAFFQWPGRLPAEWSEQRTQRATQRRMEGVCIGFQPGSSGLLDQRPERRLRTRAVTELAAAPAADGPGDDSTADDRAWHELDQQEDMSMRRARRIDVWRAGDVLHIDAAFQDSTTTPAGGRIAVHEYAILATADAATMSLRSVHAEPHVLPWAECPLATLNIGQLTGTPLSELRDEVLARLKGTAGCTHLNDAVRALAEVPVLAASI